MNDKALVTHEPLGPIGRKFTFDTFASRYMEASRHVVARLRARLRNPDEYAKDVLDRGVRTREGLREWRLKNMVNWLL